MDDRIRTIMQSHGVTQAELSRRIGITEAAVSLKCSGKRRWQLTEALRIVAFFRRMGESVTCEDLFALHDEPGEVTHGEDSERRQGSAVPDAVQPVR